MQTNHYYVFIVCNGIVLYPVENDEKKAIHTRAAAHADAELEWTQPDRMKQNV